MSAFLNAIAIYAAFLAAGWVGYNIGVERGIAKCNTHRYPRRERGE